MAHQRRDPTDVEVVEKQHRAIQVAQIVPGQQHDASMGSCFGQCLEDDAVIALAMLSFPDLPIRPAAKLVKIRVSLVARQLEQTIGLTC